MDRSLAPVVLALLAARCTTPRTSPPPSSPAASPPPTVTLGALPPSLAPAPGEAGAQGRRAIMGGRRVERQGRRVSVARDAILDDVVIAARTPSRWVFVSAAGMVLTSPSFTGPLRRVGDLPTRADALIYTPWTSGRVALTDGWRLWVTDGVELTGPTDLPQPVRALAFRDEQTGLAAVDPRGALVTRDGGRSWTAIRGDDERIDAVDVISGAFQVTTAEGPHTLDPSGQRTDAPAPPVPPRPDDAWRVALAWHRAQGHDACATGVRLRDGRCVTAGTPWRSPAHQPRNAEWGENLHGVYVSDPAAGTHASLLSEGPCDVRPLRGRAVVLCQQAWWTDDGATLDLLPLHHRRMASSWPEEIDFGHRPSGGQTRRFFTSPDKTLALATGPCRGEHAFTLPWRYGCALDAASGRSWEVTFPPNPRWQVTAVSSSAVALYDPIEASGARAAVVALADDTARAVTVGDGATLDGPLSFTREGALQGDALRAGRRLLAVGAPDAPLRTIALPDGATTARLRDARFGVARARGLDRVWRTFDGGASWTAVSLPLDGAFAAASFDDGAVTCDAVRCTVGPFTLTEGPVATTPIAFAPRTPPRPRDLFVAIRCTRGDALPRPEGLPPLPDTSVGDLLEAAGLRPPTNPRGATLWGLARSAQGPWLAALTPGDGVRLSSPSATPAPQVPPMPAAPPICGDLSTDPLTLVFDVGLDLHLGRFDLTEESSHVALELHEGAWCLRAIDAQGLSVRATGGALVGEARARDDRAAVRCEVSP